MRLRPLTLLALLALVVAAACGSSQHNRHFEDTFDGTKFPDHGWGYSGPNPVLDTTAGNGAPSMTWLACAGSNGAIAQVAETFAGPMSFDARIQFMITGTADTAHTGLAFHIFGGFGDSMAAVVEPFPTGLVSLAIDGAVADGAFGADGTWHRLELIVNSQGISAWLVDGAIVIENGPISSTDFRVEVVCGEGDAGSGPVPVLLDNLVIDARVN